MTVHYEMNLAGTTVQRVETVTAADLKQQRKDKRARLALDVTCGHCRAVGQIGQPCAGCGRQL